jgi:hypothetical protein
MDQERRAYATTVLDPRIGRRYRGRPRRRWDQEFREVVGNQWPRIARDRGKWKHAFLDINQKEKPKVMGSDTFSS